MPKESAISIVSSGPAALPSRLSGWFQQAFSSSTVHLPLLAGTPAQAALTAPLGSPERAKGWHPSKTSHTKDQDESAPRLTFVETKRSPIAPSQPHASNMRGLGTFFDKAVNYMFDTDAHSYDPRLTSDLWIMGGQQFPGVWKWDENRDEPLGDDIGVAVGHGGAGSSSDASHAAFPPKKRSALRRVTVGKTKGIFKHHHHQSSTSTSDGFRKSTDLTTSSQRNVGVSFSPSPTPSPEPSSSINLYRMADEATLLPATTTHSYPPIFYYAFTSVIGLTYRTDFPPIPCAPDRLRPTGMGTAGGRVGGMLASLSLSIGRTGKRARNAQNGSRSPSPNLIAGDRTDDEDKQSDHGTPRGLTTDVGWGCMLRTGQSLLANALLVAHLGRDWRRPLASIIDPSDAVPTEPVYARLLSWFVDSSSPLAPFSVHRFASKGKEFGKEVGEWFGPSTAAGAIKALTNEFLAAGLGVATDMDGTVYRSDVYAASSLPIPMTSKSRNSTGSLSTPWDRPVLILINVRLGLDGVNPSYYETIKATFTFPQSVGIAGGRPSSSYYFCGFQGDSLFYIDPHHSRPAIVLEEPSAPLVASAQRVALGSRYTSSSAKTDRDWEQISSTDTDSVLSGSGGSEAFSRPRNPTCPAFQKLSKTTRNPSSRSSNSSRERLDEFYMGAYPDSALRTFHPEKVRRMTLSAMDPSMLAGFLVRDASDWEDLTARIRSFKPPLFHIADVTPLWMRPGPDATISRSSAESRPSDDSDLGVDSWSEPDEWGTTSKTDEVSSTESHTRSADMGGDEEDEDVESDEEQDSPLDRMGVDDDGWDDLEGGPSQSARMSPTIASTSSVTPGKNDTLKSKSVTSSPKLRASPRVPDISSSDSFNYVRPLPSQLAQQSFAQGAEAMQSFDFVRASTSTNSEADERQDRHVNEATCQVSQAKRRPALTGIVLANVFPTHQLISSPSSPTQGLRDEPRSRNVSAATVRARHSEEQLADNEETLNHGQRRRLDSQGSMRALTA